MLSDPILFKAPNLLTSSPDLDPHCCPMSLDGAGTMNKLRQSLRRRKPAYVPEASRPHQWQADEDAVRKGTCSFPVRVSGWQGQVRGRATCCTPVHLGGWVELLKSGRLR